MLIITRYFTREFLKTFLLCMGAFVALYLLVDLFERLDDMIKRQVPFSLIVQYVLCSIPMILYRLCPLGVLLCTFITIGIFVRHQEITALKAHGISLFRVLKVFVLLAGALFVFSLWLQEYTLPFANRHAREIKNIHIKGKKLAQFFNEQQFWYRGRDAVYNIEFFEPETNTLNRITIIYFGENFQVKRRIEAERAVWVNHTWHFQNGTERVFQPDGRMTVRRFKNRLISMDNTPEDFKMSRTKGDEMSFFELRRFIAKIRKQGYNATAYEVEMHAKLSYSFITIIMAILGIPFALRIGRSGGMAMGIAISIAIGFVYWMFFAFCLSLGKAGVFSPFVSAWIANAAFGSLGLYMFLHVRQ